MVDRILPLVFLPGLVLFCGDAYKGREPTPTQQREFARRINRLASHGVAVFLLVGNHDLPNAVGKATATEIFDTLAIKNVYVSSRPQVCRIETKSGPIQVASLPWPRRGLLFGKDETKDLDLDASKRKMEELLTRIVGAHAEELDPAIPAVLAAHVWVTGCRTASEKMITIGQDHALLPGNIANPAFDYVALGHIHKQQVLCDDPPVVYAGSPERLDFSEEADEKGFYVVDIQPSDGPRRRKVA
jgi:exonuclease SbcD